MLSEYFRISILVFEAEIFNCFAVICGYVAFIVHSLNLWRFTACQAPKSMISKYGLWSILLMNRFTKEVSVLWLNSVFASSSMLLKLLFDLLGSRKRISLKKLCSTISLNFIPTRAFIEHFPDGRFPWHCWNVILYMYKHAMWIWIYTQTKIEYIEESVWDEHPERIECKCESDENTFEINATIQFVMFENITCLSFKKMMFT